MLHNALLAMLVDMERVASSRGSARVTVQQVDTQMRQQLLVLWRQIAQRAPLVSISTSLAVPRLHNALLAMLVDMERVAASRGSARVTAQLVDTPIYPQLLALKPQTVLLVMLVSSLMLVAASEPRTASNAAQVGLERAAAPRRSARVIVPQVDTPMWQQLLVLCHRIALLVMLVDMERVAVLQGSAQETVQQVDTQTGS
jgi:hypothetical protein